MIDFEDNPTRLGDYIFERHEGTLSVISSDLYEELTWIEYEREKETWHPVDCFSDLIDALYSFKRSGFDIKLTGEEFKKLIEGSHASLYYGNCLADVDDDFDCGDIDCDDCKYHTIITRILKH